MIPILITLLTALPGQDEILKKSLYFDNDKFLVTQNHINELTLFFDSLEHENIASILIEGHTDSNADSIYNIALSDRRVLSIDSLIRQIVGEGLPIFTNYFGENRPLLSNETEGGRQENRRVDVFVHLNISELEIYPNLLPKDTCIPGDTTIIMEGGTELVFDRCEYREKKDCLKITEVVTVSEMETNGLTTQTTSGDPLITFGMIGIEASPECDSCFQNPVTVRFLLDPVPDKCLRCATPATIWSMDTSSRWFTDSRGEPDIKVVEIGGLKYAEFKLYCPGWKNYDCIPSGKPKKVKFKARGGLKINSISLIYD